MNAWISRGAGLAAATAAVCALAVSGPHDVTRARLEASLTRTFTNLYLRQQHDILGHPGVSATGAGARTTCGRTSTSSDVGAGPDWICHVTWTDDAGKQQDGKFELSAKANYCYVAGGPSKLVGGLTLTDTRGRDVPNPLFEFDACYDPAS